MIRVFIDGKEVTKDAILGWESKRVSASRKLLERAQKRHIYAQNADELMKVKAAMTQDKMRSILKSRIAFGKFGTGMVVRLSGGKRKISITELDVDFCDAETLRTLYDDMMLNNTEENRRCCLRANPDHYLLRGCGENVQEVIEVTGEMPVVSHFFIRYGDFNGLQSKQEAEYPYQAAGMSYLDNGLAIGAVRHQIKNTETGCHIKLAVEFPILMPNKNIKAHQYHLACEFYNWFTEIEKRLKMQEKAQKKQGRY